MRSDRYKYDAFVSHAVEDKLPVANELCSRLEQAGLVIWYSGKELKVGDSLEKAILKGLDQSRFGIVVLSPTYLEKNWPRKEFYLLMAKEIEQRKVILPILYNITNEELQKRDISIADRWAISCDKGLDYVVEKLLEVINEEKGAEPGHHGRAAKFLQRRIISLFAVAVLLLVSYFVYASYLKNRVPDKQLIENVIEARINKLQVTIDKEHSHLLSTMNVRTATIDDITKIYSAYTNLKTNYRNVYQFENGLITVQSRKHVEAALKLDMDSLAPEYTYNLSAPQIFLSTSEWRGRILEAHYVFINIQPLRYAVSNEEILDNGDYQVSVLYKNNLRYVLVDLIFPTEDNSLKRHQVTLKGHLPVEQYIFEKTGEQWVLKEVR